MPLDFGRQDGDPDIQPLPHPERLAPAITPPHRRRHRCGRVESFLAGALVALAIIAALVL